MKALLATFGVVLLTTPAFAIDGTLEQRYAVTTEVYKTVQGIAEGYALRENGQTNDEAKIIIELFACVPRNGTKAVTTIREKDQPVAVIVTEGRYAGCRGFVPFNFFKPS